MRYLAPLFSLIFLAQGAVAQPILDTLASRVCNCMESEPEIIYPRLQATRCVNEVAARFAPQIGRELGLSMSKSDDRRQLTELLIEPLTTSCSMLQELAPGKKEPELHYSDFPLARAPREVEIAKHPPPDPNSTTLREGEEVFEVSGTLVAEGAGDTLQLRLESGELLTLLVYSRQLRRMRLSVGQPLVITYYYDWHTDETQARAVVLSME